MAQQRAREDSVVGGSEETSQPNYGSVEIPTEPPTEYTYVERRAELLQQIEDVGHPASLNQTELADRYGVSQQQISKDLDRLAEHIQSSLGARRDLVVHSVFDRAIQDLLEEDPYKAVKAAEKWDEWIDRRTEVRELRERIARLEELGVPERRPPHEQ